MADKLPGNGLWGWLGRQVGYVKKAARTTPSLPPPKSAGAKPSAPQSGGAATGAAAPPPSPDVLYRHDRVQEAEHPTEPGVKLRRTIIDEVIVEKNDGAPDKPD